MTINLFIYYYKNPPNVNEELNQNECVFKVLLSIEFADHFTDVKSAFFTNHAFWFTAVFTCLGFTLPIVFTIYEYAEEPELGFCDFVGKYFQFFTVKYRFLNFINNKKEGLYKRFAVFACLENLPQFIFLYINLFYVGMSFNFF